jgi:hemerythrin-like metal-binding protein
VWDKVNRVFRRWLRNFGVTLKRIFLWKRSTLGKINYPYLAAHKAEHQKLILKIKDTERDLKSDKIGLSVEVLILLNNWLQNHIKKSDMKSSDYMATNGKLKVPVVY